MYILLISILLISILIPFNTSSQTSFNKTIYVDDDNTSGPWDGSIEHPFKNIQDGINYSTSSDIIFVNRGLYYENLKISKSIKLTGEEKETTIINGKGNTNIGEHCITINCSNVIINGFTITNGNDGILLWTRVNNNSNSQIYDNIIINNRYGIIDDRGNFNQFYKNDIQSIYTGILLRESSNDKIFNNNISNCGSRCIHIYRKGFNNIYNNNLISEKETIYIDDSKFNKILYNNFIHETPSEKFFQINRFQFCFNTWYKNFWIDWDSILPRPIPGESRTYFYPDGGQRKIPLITFDWNPALEPYDIPR